MDKDKSHDQSQPLSEDARRMIAEGVITEHEVHFLKPWPTREAAERAVTEATASAQAFADSILTRPGAKFR